MPKRADIKKVMIIGSGPIIIGQACEFDYSGTQACKALKSLGYEIVLVNSNPATIMTDPSTADHTYIEPLNAERMEEIIAKERPDALLPNLGGQSALNLSSELAERGVLARYGVKVIGVQIDAIKRGEDREAFKETMNSLGVQMAPSRIIHTVDEAMQAAKEIGFPVVVRPAYTMGGTGGGFCYNTEELQTIVNRGLQASIVHECLIEESLLGWEELELEIVRDSKGRMITVCFIENVDPVGVHTGDSFCTAPMLTISQDVQKKMQEIAYRVVEGIGVIGGTNVQFARNPRDGRIVIIEINPRTSRSSALASKATGFPIAYVSALLAAGVTLDELPYWRDGSLDKYTPSGDYVVVKFARWAFEKFRGVQDRLGTQMRAVGEVMSIGKTYREAFQKAIRSLEGSTSGLGFYKNLHEKTLDELLVMLREPTSYRQFAMYEALKKGATIEQLQSLTFIKRYFLEEMKALVDVDDACYWFSSYNLPKDKSVASPNPRKVMVLGGGPIRIGQGIEFDYCCVHAAKELRALGYETIMVNCNPETVSTDYDTSDKLYFEPLTLEDVLAIYRKEKPLGAIVQFGGQTPLNLADSLQKNGVHILGTPPATIDMAEDRDLFRKMMDKMGVPMPESGMASNLDEAMSIATRIGFPVMVRPSFVLGGRGMEVVHDEEMLREYVLKAEEEVSPDRPILIDRFLGDALEAEADAISDGTDAFVPSVMEHIELAGIHSGDSACVIPPPTMGDKVESQIKDITRRIAIEMGVVGLMNVQFAICQGKVYVIEANPRASRTVPLVSKVCGISMARLATDVMMGKKLSELNLKERKIPHFGVKEAVFPFPMLPEVDPVLGPEMRSTGEVLGISKDLGLAFFKAEEAAKPPLPTRGTVLITVAPRDHQAILPAARQFVADGLQLLATEGTLKSLEAAGIPAKAVFKINEGRPNILDELKNGHIQLVINTPIGKESKIDDSYIRKNAIKYGVPYFTTVAAALACANGIHAKLNGADGVLSIQEYGR